MYLRFRFRYQVWIPIKRAPEKLWRALKMFCVYYKTEDWEWDSLSAPMRHQLLRIAKVQENGMRTTGPKRGRQARIAAELLRRLEEDVAWDMADLRYPNGQSRQWAKQINIVEGEYNDMLWRIFNKAFQRWWE